MNDNIETASFQQAKKSKAKYFKLPQDYDFERDPLNLFEIADNLGVTSEEVVKMDRAIAIEDWERDECNHIIFKNWLTNSEQPTDLDVGWACTVDNQVVIEGIKSYKEAEIKALEHVELWMFEQYLEDYDTFFGENSDYSELRAHLRTLKGGASC